MPAYLRFLLWPLSVIYGIVIYFWDIYWRIARKTKLSCKVISVGNIIAGGTGKTPLVIYIAQVAVKGGLRTAIVARGYRRKGKGLIEVSKDSDWRMVGDEPLEIAKMVPEARVYVCESKTTAAIKACDDGAEVIIVDDGFQHRRLYRDMNIVCLDHHRPYGNGHLLPFGLLRERPDSLDRADAVVFTSGEKPEIDIQLPWLKKGAEVYHSFTQTLAFVDLKTRANLEPKDIAAKKTLAFCGLGNPHKFAKSLSEVEVLPLDFIFFADHHPYTQLDLNSLLVKAEAIKANALITTHKDAIKLEGFDFGDLPVYYSVIGLKVEDESRFKQMMGV